MSEYIEELCGTLRDYRRQAFTNDSRLFDEDRSRPPNPPVFLDAHADRNLLLPDDPGRADRVRALVPRTKRHRWFRSMKSSQALAQSVFGGLKELESTDCLQHVMADDDAGPAFGRHTVRASDLTLEHDVNTLHEPRPTSVDVLISGPTVVCVECKLSESEIGRCSRPRLKQGHQDYCSGAYTQQVGRTDRCALTERGIAYWQHIPALLKAPEWDPGRDHAICPLAEPYQLVRNVLAACVDDGEARPDRGHALLIYDQRNPAFAPTEEGTFERLRRDLDNPTVLRRCSWQSVIKVMADYDELTWLVTGLRQKYALQPS